jgi:hypothetical protein
MEHGSGQVHLKAFRIGSSSCSLAQNMKLSLDCSTWEWCLSHNRLPGCPQSHIIKLTRYPQCATADCELRHPSVTLILPTKSTQRKKGFLVLRIFAPELKLDSPVKPVTFLAPHWTARLRSRSAVNQTLIHLAIFNC